VPHARSPIVFSGKIEDEAWKGPAARTMGFVNAQGTIARPYSEARFTWGDGHLYMILYAADEDIRAPERRPDERLTHDKFTLVFPDPEGTVENVLEVTPRGVLTDGVRPAGSGPEARFDVSWSSGAQVLADAEEEIDNPDDEDEEWIVEASVPLEKLGYRAQAGERVVVNIQRCDLPKGGAQSCGSWGSAPPMVLVLDAD
jgi:hypothetical protein